MANLNDILQGLVNTDTKIIEKLGTIQDAVGDDLQNSLEELKRGSGAFSIMDTNTTGTSSAATKTADVQASNGYCYKCTQNSSSTISMLNGTFSDVKFGNYGLCLRMKADTANFSANAFTVTINTGTTNLLTKTYTGTVFTTNSNYVSIYVPFTYQCSGSVKNKLSITVAATTGNKTLYLDYAYIQLMMPAVFV